MLIVYDKNTGDIIQTVSMGNKLPCKLEEDQDYIQLNNREVPSLFRVSKFVVDPRNKQLREKNAAEKEKDRRQMEEADKKYMKRQEKGKSRIKDLEERLATLEKKLGAK